MGKAKIKKHSMRAKILKMRRLTLLILTLILFLYLSGAEHLQAQVTSGITSPATGSSISGSVSIQGTAVIEPFQKYELYFKKEPNGDDAYIWFAGGAAPVTNGQLGVLQADGLEPGVYTLRLRVVKNDGNYAEFFAPNISINQSSGPTETPTPSGPIPTPIPTSTFTPAPQPTPVVGQVTQPDIGDGQNGDSGATSGAEAGSEEDNAAEPVTIVVDAAEGGSAEVTAPDENAADADQVGSNSVTRQLGEALAFSKLRERFIYGMRVSAVLFLIVGLIFLSKRIFRWVRTQV